MSNDHLYAKRWETIVDNRDEIDIVQIITWNDYGESHYIGPIQGDQPNSQAWVDGFDHTAWLDMTTYYANAFKTGSYPEINKDKIYLWSRPHPRDATASSDSVGKPDSYQLLEDAVYAVIMATSPSKVTLSTGPSSKTFDVPAGVTKLTIPISAGGTMYGKVERDGNTIVELDPEFNFDPNPKTYNYNALVAFAVAGGDEVPPGKGTPTNGTPSSSVVSTPVPSPSSSSSSEDGQPTPAPSPSPSPSSFSSSVLEDVQPTPTPSSSGDEQPTPTPSPSPSPSPSEGPNSDSVPNPYPSPIALNAGNNVHTCSHNHRRRRH